MKKFKLVFGAHHSTQYNKQVIMYAQAKSLEKVLPRVKKILKELKKLPNPHAHDDWIIINIKELSKNDD